MIDPAQVRAAYDRAVALGYLPQGVPVGTGRHAATQAVASELGMSLAQVKRLLLKPVEAPQKPRVRVPAGVAPSPEPEPAPMFPGGLLPSPAFVNGPRFSFTTEPDHTFAFGAVGDCHLGSKYERLDVLEDLYDYFAERGVTTVFHTGNWIDGEARFNVHDLHTRGVDAQLRYLAKHYPQRPGITTYAVTGDDHEGWYAQREGIDIGAYAQRVFRDAGRTDWVDLGYMEAPVRLVDASSGRAAIASIVHPGGGATYAASYAVQKVIESLDGGEKPAAWIGGHWHSVLLTLMVRNVWCVLTGCTQDQTPFLRKKRVAAMVGGHLCRATIDPRTGAITGLMDDARHYFNRGYYAGRWSHHGPINAAERVGLEAA